MFSKFSLGFDGRSPTDGCAEVGKSRCKLNDWLAAVAHKICFRLVRVDCGQ